MKIHFAWLAAILFISVSAKSQQKLTIEEAVMGQFRQFAPKTLDQAGWMGNSDSYVYVKDNAMMVATATPQIEHY